jgi:hypothetical protein
VSSSASILNSDVIQDSPKYHFQKAHPRNILFNVF